MYMKAEMGDHDELKAALREFKPAVGDVTHAAVSAAIQLVPVVGGLGADLFKSVVAPPLSKRQDKLLIMVAEGLVALRDQRANFDIEKLSEDEGFISTTITHALHVGLRTHQEEKLAALRNAVLNSALPNAPDDDLQLMFVNLIDRFTSWHLEILSYSANPRAYGEQKGIIYPKTRSETGDLTTPILHGMSGVLEFTFPELASRHTFCRQVVRELYAQGLTGGDVYDQGKSFSEWAGLLEPYTLFISELGKEFLIFITSPVPSERNIQSHGKANSESAFTS